MLVPHEPRKEPMFGEGALPFITQLLGLAAALVLILFVLILGRTAYSSVSATLWGEPHQAAAHLAPGQSAVVDGVTIKRIN